MTHHENDKTAITLRYAIIAVAAFGLAALVFGSKAVADNVIAYDMNATGMTYGSAIDAPSPDSEPDLIEAVATNGEIGYVKKSELDAASQPARNPEEAVAMMSEREKVQKEAFYEYLNEQSTRKSIAMAISESEAGEIFDEIMENPNGANTAVADISSTDTALDESILLCAFEVALESTKQQIPVYAIDGETVIGSFMVG